MVLKAASSPCFSASTSILSSKLRNFAGGDITQIFFGLLNKNVKEQAFIDRRLKHRAPVPSLEIICIRLAKILQAVSKG